ncbi:hypothetical protein NOF55_16790 [Rhizobiaceae bacterium BDR2-2]|uniref:Uncharacterized protein n=1 Tax=Ectorhizobium quercum TaxID=2965071 RepID=A0AAE3N2L6_9HYPH|nr:hypothetical protein [Ectorhizobium quercum]MCX8996189.1 hypothetical protein [Ectorhizobium quercum]MCX8998772.1 hypothetical protein [Ectorhizobium quercum]
MSDPFLNTHPSLSGPATAGFAVTPSDGAELAQPSRALYVGGAGDLAVTLLSGDSVSLGAVPAGSLLPLRVSRVHATGTTATAIVALI